MKTNNLLKVTYILISLLLLTIGFSSCNNDDDDLTSNYSTSLIGKWQVTVDEKTDAYIVTFNSDYTALIEQYKEFEKNGMSKNSEECRVTWNVENNKIVFNGGKAWFAFGYTPVTLVSVTQNSIVGSQWFKDSNVHFTRM